jgi:hypothetical protein
VSYSEYKYKKQKIKNRKQKGEAVGTKKSYSAHRAVIFTIIFMAACAGTLAAAIGEGSAVINPSSVVMGSSGNTLAIDYTAGATNWDISPGYGTLAISIPAGWSAPSGNPTDAGYFSVTVTTGSATGSMVLGQDLEVFVQGLNAGEKIRVIYGDRSGGGPGATAQNSAGSVEFTVKSQPSGTSAYKINNSPLESVIPATATATSTITPTYTITPNTTPGKPGGLASQQSGNTVTLSWSTSASVNYYKVYTATGPAGRLNPFPAGWTAIATVLPTPVTSSYSNTNTTDDYLFYTVTGVNLSGEGGPATMAARVRNAMSFTAGRPNGYIVSLPYNSKYTRASDIVIDIEGSPATGNKTNRVGLWYPNAQAFSMFNFVGGSWLGIDWPIDGGSRSLNAVYLNVPSTAAAYTWVVAGTDSVKDLYFKHQTGLPNENIRFMPFTSAYRKASDVVRDIEGGTGPGTNTKISKIGAWNVPAQAYIFFIYQSGGWIGIDFDIKPGDALNVWPSASVNEFTWTPKISMTPVP